MYFSFQIYVVMSSCAILALAVMVTISTLPEFKHYRIVNSSMMNTSVQSIEETAEFDDGVGGLIQTSVLALVTIFFLLEFVARIIFCPDKKHFLLGLINVCDFFSLLLLLVCLTVSGSVNTLKALCVVLRLVRLLWFCRHVKMQRACAYTYRSSWRDIFYLILFFYVASFIFATLVYNLEASSMDSHYMTIPDAMYWAMITLTTVGYGDMRPIGKWGKLAASFCALTGVFTYCLIAALIAVKFHQYFSRVQYERKRKYRYICCCRQIVKEENQVALV